MCLEWEFGIPVPELAVASYQHQTLKPLRCTFAGAWIRDGDIQTDTMFRMFQALVLLWNEQVAPKVNNSTSGSSHGALDVRCSVHDHRSIPEEFLQDEVFGPPFVCASERRSWPSTQRLHHLVLLSIPAYVPRPRPMDSWQLTLLREVTLRL